MAIKYVKSCVVPKEQKFTDFKAVILLIFTTFYNRKL
jgi:hypothetical protein